MPSTLLLLLLLSLANTLMLSIVLYALFVRPRPRRTAHPYVTVGKAGGSDSDSGRGATCSASTCGATDPVSDPAYNMREIVKQSVLLEEHLSVDAKYCRDCIIKHFLTLVGLAEEAQMLAGERVDDYPMLAESAGFYRAQMSAWLDGEDDHRREERLAVGASLREFRKRLVAAYYPSSE